MSFLHRRLGLAKFRMTQARMNALYAPPSFDFADRYAGLLKVAALVLVFGAAAPLLYFLGAAVLFFSFARTKYALVKMYARPKQLDASLAQTAYWFLLALLGLKVSGYIRCAPPKAY